MRFFFLTLLCIFSLCLTPTKSTFRRLLKTLERLSVDEIDQFLALSQNYSRTTPPELIEQENFPSETHNITTEDGYILTVYRIPGGLNSTPVFLQHGLLENSADWLFQGKKKSLPYILSENGYDVWLGNARGNTYSRRHEKLSVEDPQFWNFSMISFYIWEQLGKYDLPAVITYITNLKQESLFYIGHSMGATTFSVMAIERPDVAKKVKAMIGLAPATYSYHMRNFLKLLAPLWKEVQVVLELLGIHEFLPHNKFFDIFANLVCSSRNTLISRLCEIPLFLIAGFHPKKINTSVLPQIWKSFPSGTSTKLFVHFLQQTNVNQFRSFDYGSQNNLKLYNSTNPPIYNLSDVKVPVAVFWSANDWIIGPNDVDKFYKQVPLKLGTFKVRDTKYNHFDFLWAKDAAQLVYTKVLNIMMMNYKSRAQ